MGKIKTRLIKRTANRLMDNLEELGGDFNSNKKMLGKEMPSKKVRNQIAGYVSRVKKRQKKQEEKVQESIEAISKKKVISQ